MLLNLRATLIAELRAFLTRFALILCIDRYARHQIESANRD